MDRGTVGFVTSQFEVKRQIGHADNARLALSQIHDVLTTNDVNFGDLSGLAYFGDFDHVLKVGLRGIIGFTGLDRHVATHFKVVGHTTRDHHENDARMGNQVTHMLPAFAGSNHAAQNQVECQQSTNPVTTRQRQRHQLVVDLRDDIP